MAGDLKDRVNEAEDKKFDSLGFDWQEALKKLNFTLKSMGQKPFNFDEDSIHWLIFSALSLKAEKYPNILELGTFTGSFTHLASKLFPESRITTVDLSENDPLFLKLYSRHDPDRLQEYRKLQARNLNSPNIMSLQLNTFFLLDKVRGPFDLIWVDAGHHYPEIAWDICNAYHLCRPGGTVLCDDLIPKDIQYHSTHVSPAGYETLTYIQDRLPSSLTLFLKRRSLDRYLNKQKRRYVGYLAKP